MKRFLCTTIALMLALTAVFSIRKGFTFMPTIDMPNVSVTVAMPEDAEMDDAVAMADEVLAKIGTLEGIATVGANMSSGDTTSLLGGGSGGARVRHKRRAGRRGSFRLFRRGTPYGIQGTLYGC